MKAILVIDQMPMNCMTCRHRFSEWYEEVGTIHICSMSNKRLREEDFGKNRADFCPLRPLPERKHEGRPMYGKSKDFIIGVCIDEHAKGWNDCLEKITGGTE